jgi:hypothetical protein
MDNPVSNFIDGRSLTGSAAPLPYPSKNGGHAGAAIPYSMHVSRKSDM